MSITSIIHRRDGIYQLFKENHHNNYYKRFLYCDSELLIDDIDTILCSYSSRSNTGISSNSNSGSSSSCSCSCCCNSSCSCNSRGDDIRGDDIKVSNSDNNTSTLIVDHSSNTIIVNDNILSNNDNILNNNSSFISISSSSNVEQDEIEENIKILKSIKEKLKYDIIINCELGYIHRKHDNIIMYIIDRIDQFIRLLAVWLFLIISSIFIAIPCIFLTPIDFILVRCKVLSVYHQSSVLLTVFTAQTILRLSGIALVLHGKLIDADR